MDTMDGLSMDLERANLDKLRTVFPECFTEGKLDIDKLLSLCGEYIDNDFEKYRFEWKGKAECLRLAQKRSAGTLRPCPGESVDWEHTRNLYIEGDNLEVLKLLQTAYYRKVKMIYIDPPYNTGNDFVYADDFADPLARYREVTAQTTKSNPETMGRFHTNWLNMMYPRLRLAANLLRDDGVIVISIDDAEIDNLKKLCNEVFGEENFLACLIWEKTRKNDARFFSIGHEYILVYAKSETTLRENNVYWREDKPGAHEMYREYELLRTKYGDDFPAMEKELKEYYANLPKDHPAKKHSRYNKIDEHGIWRDHDISWPGGGGPRYDVIHPVTGKPCKVPPSGWRFPTLERMQEMIDNGLVVFREDHTEPPIRKSYLVRKMGRLSDEESIGKQVMGTYFYRSALQATNEVADLLGPRVFDYPKDREILMRLIGYMTSAQNNDIILDFFSGSATTAHAVMQLNAEDGGNRRYIMVQLPELCDEKSEAFKAGYKNICEIGKERIKRANLKIWNDCFSSAALDLGMILLDKELEDEMGKSAEKKMDNAESLDVGFRVFKLDSSNLKTWDAAPIAPQAGDVIGELANRMNAMIHRVKPDRSDLDMVFEVMLKLGVPLDFPVTEVSVNGKTAYSVGEDCLLLVCLTPDIQPEDVEQMAEYAPAKAVISRDSFADDTAMANAWYILRDRGVDLKLV